jgi:hypothetical protein
MKKKQPNPVPTEAVRIGAEAWLAVRARQGAGLHKTRRRTPRAVERRRALAAEE